MKKISCIIISLLIILSCVPLAFASQSEYYSDARDLIATQLKTAMFSREEEVSVDFVLSIADLEDQSVLNSLFADAEQKALVHTGNADEGDYLANSFTTMSVSFMYFSGGDIVNLTANFKINYKTGQSQENQVNEKLSSVMPTLVNDSMTIVEKISAITDYICNICDYDFENYDNPDYGIMHTAYGALIDGKAVCDGYSSLFYKMCLLAGIDCRLISGTAFNGSNTEGHAWNIVRIGEKYYNIDVTWIDNTHSRDNYYLKGDSFFSNHFRDSVFTQDSFTNAYPVSAQDYQPENTIQHEHVISEKFEVISDSTCEAEGSAYKITYCTVCNNEFLYTIIQTPATGHNYDKNIISKAGCETVGVFEYVCTNDENHKYTEEINPTGHIGGDILQTNIQLPSCTASGSFDEVVYCTVCNIELSRNTVITEMTGHKEVKESDILPSCSTDGLTGAVYCEVCNEVLTDSVILSATGHDYDDGVVVKEATSDEEGILSYTCKICGDVRTDAIEKLPPEYISGDIDFDNQVTAADARLALRIAVGLENYPDNSIQLLCADVDNDSKVTAADARLILRCAVNLEDLSKYK